MSGNQLTPGSNVVSSLGVSGVVYQKLSFGTDDANATPMTGYEDESTIATDSTEDDLEDVQLFLQAEVLLKVW